MGLKISNDNAEAHFNLGVTLLKMGEKSAALDQYKTLMGLDRALASRLFDLIY